MLALTLLGGLALESDAAPESLPASAFQRRRLLLLAVLALGGPRGFTRGKIQAHLWPESPAEAARHALEQLLYATRRDLGRQIVLGSAEDLRLNPAEIRVDTWAFDAALREERWRDAVELHAGPLLDGVNVPGVELERLIDAERERLTGAYRRALATLARRAGAAGDHLAAVRWWQSSAASDPYSAPVARETVRALVMAGDAAGAVRHARIYEQMVRTGLGVEPDPSVGALAATLPSADVGDEPVTPSSAPGAAPPAAPMQEDGALTTDDALALAPDRDDLPRHRRRHVAAAGAAVMLTGLAVLAPRIGVERQVPRNPAMTARAVGEDTAGPFVADYTARAAAISDGPHDAEVHALYLRGRAAWNQRSRTGLDSAVILFRRATERDPLYAAAYTGLAESYVMIGYFGFAPGDAMYAKARLAALRAIALDPRSAGEAYAALGHALAGARAWSDAERAFQQAVRLAPGNPTVHQWYALFLAYMGRAREAAAHTARASALDPLSVQINNMHGMMLFHAGDTAGAMRQYRRTVDAEPDSAWVSRNPWVLSNFAVIAAATGDRALARRLIGRALTIVPTHPRPLLDLALMHVDAGEPDSARAVFDRADPAHPHYAAYRALLAARLHERDSAFLWMARAREFPLPALVTLNNSPQYAQLRSDPRFRAVRARLRIPAVP